MTEVGAKCGHILLLYGPVWALCKVGLVRVPGEGGQMHTHPKPMRACVQATMYTPAPTPTQVATPRVRTAAKKDIPHLDDHVSKLNGVGNATQVGDGRSGGSGGGGGGSTSPRRTTSASSMAWATPRRWVWCGVVWGS